MKRLLVIESAYCFSEILLEITKNRSGEKEVRSLIPTSEEAICASINEYHPDIVIMDDSNPSFVFTTVMHLLVSLAALRLVFICGDSNDIQIYDKQHIETAHIADLLSAL